METEWQGFMHFLKKLIFHLGVNGISAAREKKIYIYLIFLML